jgi:predicted GNAT family N-acyltransferase
VVLHHLHSCDLECVSSISIRIDEQETNVICIFDSILYTEGMTITRVIEMRGGRKHRLGQQVSRDNLRKANERPSHLSCALKMELYTKLSLSYLYSSPGTKEA